MFYHLGNLTQIVSDLEISRFQIDFKRKKGDNDIALYNLSPQEIEEFVQMWGDVLLPTKELKHHLTTFSQQDWKIFFSAMMLKERLQYLKPEERLADLSIEEIEAYLEQRKKQS